MKAKTIRYRKRSKTDDERFDAKVEKTESCWNWTGAKNSMGYGAFSILGKVYPAHRFSYRRAKGEIPKGLDLDHLCRNPACVNPDHLEAVTRSENVRRGKVSALRHLSEKCKPKTHCPQGHEYTEDNIYITKRGYRFCRACRLERAKVRMQNDKPFHPRRMTEQERFFEKVEFSPECWQWIGANHGGSGYFAPNKRTMLARVYSYELHRGKIPEGRRVACSCGNSLCVNPAHLHTVESKRKGNRIETKPRPKRGAIKTHCKRGHELSADNVRTTIIGGKLQRQCRICERMSKDKINKQIKQNKLNAQQGM